MHHFLERSAERFPDKVALICDGRRLTYAQIEELTNRIAHGLTDYGIKRGDRVVIWLPNSVEVTLAIFAALKAGAVFAVIHSGTKMDRLTYVLNNCTAAALFAPAPHLESIVELLDRVPSLRCVVLVSHGTNILDQRLIPLEQLLAYGAASRPQPQTIDVDLACLVYTSGSTGEPKGVMCTHANVVFAVSAITEYLENTPRDIVINVLPLSFDYGLYQLLMTFAFGGTLVLERSFAYPVKLLQQIERERVTGLPGVPTLFAMLLQMDLTPYDLSSLRYLTNTAAALPVEHIRRLRAAFPWARLYSMYGLTECKRALYLPPEELDRRPASVGIPIPGTEAWIEDDTGRRVEPGEVGELVVRGAHVMQGYWGDAEETAKRYRVGRYPADRMLYTGDLFTMDEDGFFYFVARKDDIIKSRGEKVAPKEVEHVIYQLPGVTEVAVFGVPDPILGEAIKAVIVANGSASLTERDVRRHCAQHLEEFKIPHYVEFRPSLPHSASGKIDKAALKERGACAELPA